MGFGDEIIASGLARGAVARGKRIAFGDGRRIFWSSHSHEIFKNNPNIAKPGSEGTSDLEWISHYGGHRLYGGFANGKWHWKNFTCIPGEIYFDADELIFPQGVGEIIIEPRVKNKPNKQWAVEKYQQLADELTLQGYACTQLVPPKSAPLLKGIQAIYTSTFRRALGALSKAKLYVGAEGGLHHGAAAVGIDAVVIFGGFIGPETTGYANHRNIFKGPACGSQAPCPHCRNIMESISVDEVLCAVLEKIGVHNRVAV